MEDFLTNWRPDHPLLSKGKSKNATKTTSNVTQAFPDELGEALKTTKDQYLTHTSVTDNAGKSLSLVIMSYSYCLIDVEKHCVDWQNEYRYLHCVEKVFGSSKKLDIVSREVTKAASVLNVAKRFKSSATAGLRNLTLTFSSQSERDEMEITFAAVMRTFWQTYFERFFIAEPQIYQYHRFLTKIASKGGHQQARLLLLSSERLHNIEVRGSSFDIVSCKWSFPLTSLQALVRDESSPNVFSFQITSKTVDSIKGLASEYSWLCRNSEESEEMYVFLSNLSPQIPPFTCDTHSSKEIHRLYYNQTGTYLKTKTKSLAQK